MTKPTEIDDNDPRLPSEDWLRRYYDDPRSSAALLDVVRAAAKHALAQASGLTNAAKRHAILQGIAIGMAQAQSLTNREKREIYNEGATDHACGDADAHRRYPDPVPAFAERFQVGDEHFRRSSDGRVERAQYTDGRRPSWAPLTEAERTALKALAEGL